MRTTKPIGISIPDDLLKVIDEKRGRIPRSIFIVDLLKEALSKERVES